MSAEIKKVVDYLKAAKVFYVATVEGDQPRVRPFGAVEIIDGKIYMLTGKVKPVSKQLAANPKVEICAACPDNTWLRVEAVTANDDNIETKKKFIELFPQLASMYSPEDNNMQILYLKDATATFYAFGGEPVVVKF